MKKLLFFLSLVIMFSSKCKEDPCEGIECLNGGSCIEGNCDCPEGFSGINCEIEENVIESCNDDNCINGHCVDDKCECDTGYSGSKCNNEKTPTEMTITKLEVLKMSTTNSAGDPWDATSDPDIFIMVYKGLNNKIWKSDTIIDADPSKTYEFIPDQTVVIDSTTGSYTIGIYDHDDSSQEESMGGYSIQPYPDIEGDGFPEKIDIKSTGNDTHFRLHVTYKFN